MTPKVSVIIPTYNAEKFLDLTIQSVLYQTFKDWELIIVDDCSTDHTREIIKKWEERDKRIHSYFLSENFGGPAKPFNIGIENSSGEFIAFLEADDEWLPEKLEKQLRIFEEFKSVDLVTCNAFRKFNGKQKIYQAPFKGILKKENWQIFWEKWGIISPSTVIVRKNLIEKIGTFDENLKASTDADFYMRAIKECDFYFLLEILVNYQESQESLSKKQFWIKWIPEYEYLLKKYQTDFKEFPFLKIKFLKTLGTCYLLNNNLSQARNYFKEAIKINPKNLRLYLQFGLSFWPFLYKKILFLKRKIF